jgi:hypothetical protein
MLAGYLGAETKPGTKAVLMKAIKQSPAQKALGDAWNKLTLPQAQLAVSNLVKRLKLTDEYEKGYFKETGKNLTIEAILAEYGKSKATLIEVIDGMTPDEQTRLIIMEELSIAMAAAPLTAGVAAKTEEEPNYRLYLGAAIVALGIWYYKFYNK